MSFIINKKLALYRNIIVIIVIGLFAILAVIISKKLTLGNLGLNSQAQSISILEPENGALAGTVAIVSDLNTSQGKYIEFGVNNPIITPTITPIASANLITDASIVYTIPQLPKPAYLNPIIDQIFHTQVTRIAGDSTSSFTISSGVTGTWGTDARHHYSKDQPWSADGSIIALQNNGSPSHVYLDGNTYLPKYKCDFSGDDRWHPSKMHPHERINITGNVIQWRDVTNCTITKTISLPFTPFGFGQGEGNASFNGQYVALSDNTSSNLYVIDMVNGIIGPATDIKNCGLTQGCTVDWASISPSGKFVVVSYNPDTTRVFDVNLSTLAITPRPMSLSTPECDNHDRTQGYVLGLGHADMTFDPYDNNNDVIIGQNRSGSTFVCPQTINGIKMGSVIKVSLNDGAVTTLTDPTNEASAHHISTRNDERLGWVYVTYYKKAGARFSNEIVALKIDGSKQVERYFQTHSTAAPYRNEEHGVPSHDGQKIIFASGWDQDCTVCGTSSNPQDYVIDARSGFAMTTSQSPNLALMKKAPMSIGSLESNKSTSNWQSLINKLSFPRVEASGEDEIHYTVFDGSTVSINWRGASNNISYGKTTTYGSNAFASPPLIATPFSSSGPFWQVKLTGLTANTIYHYSIGGGPDHTFKTGIPKGDTSTFTVDAIGDIGDSKTYANVGIIAGMIKNDHPDLAFGVGDLTYANDHGQAVVDQHFIDEQVWSGNGTAYMPAWGNHEWDKPANDDLRNYKGRFDLPNPQTSPGAVTPGGEDWYWFDYGVTRFIAYPEPWTGAISDWNSKANSIMDNAQADPSIKYIMTFGHRPAYSSAHHPGETTLKDSIDALAAKHSKYVLNINGHSHNYERSYPQKNTTVSGANPEAPGVIHITSGGGGASLEQDGTCLYLTCIQPSWSAKRYMRVGVTRLTFTSTGIKGEYICGPSGSGVNDINCTQGSVIDTFYIGSPSSTSTPTIINTPVSTVTPTPCPTIPETNGVITSNISINTSGNYRIWSRMMGNGSFYLKIGNNCAINIGGLNLSNWTWVGYLDANINTISTINLQAGTYPIKLIGKESNVKVDKLLFDDSSCIPVDNLAISPQSFGDNCLITTTSVPTATNLPTSTPVSTSTPTKLPTLPPSTTTPTTINQTNKSKGDFNNDGKVDILDLSLLAANWMQTTSIADADGNGVVDIIDLSILSTYWMQTV